MAPHSGSSRRCWSQPEGLGHGQGTVGTGAGLSVRAWYQFLGVLFRVPDPLPKSWYGKDESIRDPQSYVRVKRTHSELDCFLLPPRSSAQWWILLMKFGILEGVEWEGWGGPLSLSLSGVSGCASKRRYCFAQFWRSSAAFRCGLPGLQHRMV